MNDTNINDKWSKFFLALGTMRLLNAPRDVSGCEERRVEIQGFCDSSGKGYGACVFACVVCENAVMVKLWTSKCRLAPEKEISIPGLELLACFLWSKLIALMKTVVETEVEIVKCSVGWICKLRCGEYGKGIKSGRFGCRTRSRKFGRMLAAKTGFMYQLHWIQQMFVQGSVWSKGWKNVHCSGTVQSFC